MLKEALRTYARLDEALRELRQAVRRLEELLCRLESSGVPSTAPAPRPESLSGREIVQNILKAFEQIQESKVAGEGESDG